MKITKSMSTYSEYLNNNTELIKQILGFHAENSKDILRLVNNGEYEEKWLDSLENMDSEDIAMWRLVQYINTRIEQDKDESAFDRKYGKGK